MQTVKNLLKHILLSPVESRSLKSLGRESISICLPRRYAWTIFVSVLPLTLRHHYCKTKMVWHLVIHLRSLYTYICYTCIHIEGCEKNVCSLYRLFFPWSVYTFLAPCCISVFDKNVVSLFSLLLKIFCGNCKLLILYKLVGDSCLYYNFVITILLTSTI